jgi:hypothetical protein
MPNITIENIDTGSVVLEQVACQDATLRNSDADDPDTFLEGTILARNSSTLKLEPYAPAGSTGLNIPVAVLTYDVGPVAAVTDVGVRVLTAGRVNQRRLIIHGGTTITAAHLDLLRSFAIIPEDVVQLGSYDNPA